MGAMSGRSRPPTDAALRRTPLFRRLGDEDRRRVAAVSALRRWERGETLFFEGDAADHLAVVVSGRVKVSKATPAGRDLILAIFGPGDAVGAVAVYEGRPYPATAEALEDTECILVPRAALFSLLERHPTLARGLLLAMTHRLVELTRRLAELTGGRIEPRLARLFLKLADDVGRPTPEGVHIPLSLSRQELADLTGTTIETAIRVMSRWGKRRVVATERDGFTIVDRAALERIAAE